MMSTLFNTISRSFAFSIFDIVVFKRVVLGKKDDLIGSFYSKLMKENRKGRERVCVFVCVGESVCE